jgi:hypothetical protein
MVLHHLHHLHRDQDRSDSRELSKLIHVLIETNSELHFYKNKSLGLMPCTNTE